MRLEIRYPDRPPHEVELSGAMAVLGRDPSCDLVIGDERCSRRHAVLELTPTGLQVRDAGSANGVFVNGKKKERALLTPGDLIRLGDVILKVLPEQLSGTVVVADGEILDLGPSPTDTAPHPGGPTALGTDAALPRASGPPSTSGMRARKPPSGPLSSRSGSRSTDSLSPSPAPRADASPRSSSASSPGLGDGARHAPRTTGGADTDPGGRPLTVTLLAALWLVSVVVYAAQAALSFTLGLTREMALISAAAAIVLCLVSAAMAFGLFGLKAWARSAQVGIAGLGILVCPFTLASATTLIYVLRPSTKAAFTPGAKAPADPAEMTFALTLAGTVVLGAALCLAGVLAQRFLR